MTFKAIMAITIISSSAMASSYEILPPQSSIVIDRETTISVRFLENVNASSVTKDNIKIIGSIGGYYNYDLEAGAPGMPYLLTPTNPFQLGEKITVILTNRILLASGQPIQPFAWQFTIGGKKNCVDFEPTAVVPVAASPRMVVSGDFIINGGSGGYPDIVVSSGPYPPLNGMPTVTILENRGGVFVIAQTFDLSAITADLAAFDNNNSMCAVPTWLVAGDFDQANGLDFAISYDKGHEDNDCGYSAKSITIFYNNGNGQFSADSPSGSNKTYLNVESAIPSGGSGPGNFYPFQGGLDAGDINGDGMLDFVIPNANVGDGAKLACVILSNVTSPPFDSPTLVNIQVPNNPMAANVTILDWDLDGYLDFAAAVGLDCNNNIVVFKNNGIGTFSECSGYEAKKFRAGWLSAGVFPQQDRFDIVASFFDKADPAHCGPNESFKLQISGLLGECNINLLGESIGLKSHAPLVADFDGDGYNEVIVMGAEEKKIAVFDFVNGTFSRSDISSVPFMPFYGTFGDWDLDGDIDLAASNFEDGLVTIYDNKDCCNVGNDGSAGRRRPRIRICLEDIMPRDISWGWPFPIDGCPGCPGPLILTFTVPEAIDTLGSLEIKFMGLPRGAEKKLKIQGNGEWIGGSRLALKGGTTIISGYPEKLDKKAKFWPALVIDKLPKQSSQIKASIERIDIPIDIALLVNRIRGNSFSDTLLLDWELVRCDKPHR